MSEENKVENKVTHIALIVDESSSMSSIARQTVDMINAQIDSVKQQQIDDSNSIVTMSIVTFGSTVKFDDTRWMQPASTINSWKNSDFRPSGMTALLDAVGKTQAKFQQSIDADNDNASFLLIAITDGEENNSIEWKNVTKFNKHIKTANDTGRYTLAVMVPRGHKAKFCRDFQVPEGNVSEWEANIQGAEKSSDILRGATSNYLKSR